MKKPLTSLILIVIILVSTIFVGGAFATPNQKIPVIVGFKELPDASLVHAHGGEIKYKYSSIQAMACSLPPQAIEALKKNPKVAYVEEDVEVQATEYNSGGMQDWGVIKIGAKVVHETVPNNLGTGVKVAVIDTGINYNHMGLKKNSLDAYR